MSSKMIKTVSFDLWFTLIWEKHPEDEETYSSMRVKSILEVLKSRGYDIPVTRVRELYFGLGASRMFMSSRDIASIILAGLGIKIDDDLVSEVAEAYELSTETFRPRENPEAVEVLPLLKDMGLKIAVVSNTSFSERGVRALLKNIGILSYVDVVVSSSNVGSVKPQRSIFQELVRAASVGPAEIVHVGDSCFDDVLGALVYGMRAVYYVGLLHLRRMEPSKICLELVPTVRKLNELPTILQDME
ncbi:MAG: HAD family hydrolase [Sulfolobales archaeon]